jgi:hypothetical protein
MNKHLLVLTVVAILATFSSSALAQDHGPPAGGSDKNLRDSSSDVKGRSNEIERVKRDADKTEATEKAETSSTPAPNFSQIKEDFERIQILNSDFLQVNASSKTPTYERISEAAAEIQKRAIRLNSNLFAPKSGKQAKKNEAGPEHQELKSLLVVLDNAITSFAHSPIFQSSTVVKHDDTKNAQNELEKVIKLSAAIKLEAERMKTNSPPQ